MDRKRLASGWFLPVLVFLAAPARSNAAVPSAGLFVDLVNADVRGVSVPAGTDNGVAKGSDFEILLPDNTVVPIYPHELFAKRFWSAPLPPDLFGRMTAGLPVRPATPGGEAHDRIRAEGAARARGLKAEIEAAKREAARKEVEALRERKGRLEEQRQAQEDRIAAAEKTLADEEGRLNWVDDSGDQDIDRALQNIQDFADRRDELQAQRDALAGQRGSAAELRRLTAEIRRLNDRIAAERDTIRTARDRKRSARSAYLDRKREWQKAVADRKALAAEIQGVDRKIKELSGR